MNCLLLIVLFVGSGVFERNTSFLPIRSAIFSNRRSVVGVQKMTQIIFQASQITRVCGCARGRVGAGAGLWAWVSLGAGVGVGGRRAAGGRVGAGVGEFRRRSCCVCGSACAYMRA